MIAVSNPSTRKRVHAACGPIRPPSKHRYRITLFVEVLNLTDRENVRYAGHEFGSVNPGTGQIRNLTSQQFPILPTAGIMFEL